MEPSQDHRASNQLLPEGSSAGRRREEEVQFDWSLLNSEYFLCSPLSAQDGNKHQASRRHLTRHLWISRTPYINIMPLIYMLINHCRISYLFLSHPPSPSSNHRHRHGYSQCL